VIFSVMWMSVDLGIGSFKGACYKAKIRQTNTHARMQRRFTGIVFSFILWLGCF